MNLTSPSQVKAWCIEHGFHPNKTLGQNFLIDRNVLESIVDTGLKDARDGEPVLEIGPGLGVLTEEILHRGHDVIAIEKDPALADTLAERLAGSEAAGKASLRVVQADALDVQIPSLEPRPEIMVSNLPYQAGTRILIELASQRGMRTMTALLQSEVVERLGAKEGSRARSLASVLVQLDYDVETVRKVAATCFWPRPEIGSAVVRLVRHERFAALEADERKLFKQLAKIAFSHRRKQLASIFKGITASTARAETLSMEDWIDFTRIYKEKEKQRSKEP